MTTFKVQTTELDSTASLLNQFAGNLRTVYRGNGPDNAFEDPRLQGAMAQVSDLWTARIDQTVSDLHSLADGLSGASSHYSHTDSRIAGAANAAGGQCTENKTTNTKAPRVA
jgi:hypothetical protein